MIKKEYRDIINQLPYKSSFLFVDNILLLTEDEVTGDYMLKKDAFFYEDHFPGNPVTPGAIITEIMAQIGVVVLGIYLVSMSPGEFTLNGDDGLYPLLTSTDIQFCKMALPGGRVTVISKKQYFRFGKLKCYVEMHDAAGEVIAKGMISGLIRQIRPNK